MCTSHNNLKIISLNSGKFKDISHGYRTLTQQAAIRYFVYGESRPIPSFTVITSNNIRVFHGIYTNLTALQ